MQSTLLSDPRRSIYPRSAFTRSCARARQSTWRHATKSPAVASADQHPDRPLKSLQSRLSRLRWGKLPWPQHLIGLDAPEQVRMLAVCCNLVGVVTCRTCKELYIDLQNHSSSFSDQICVCKILLYRIAICAVDIHANNARAFEALLIPQVSEQWPAPAPRHTLIVTCT